MKKGQQNPKAAVVLTDDDTLWSKYWRMNTLTLCIRILFFLLIYS